MKTNINRKITKTMIPIIISIFLQNIFLLGAISYEVTAINELSMGTKNLNSIAGVIVLYMLYIGASLVYARLESKSIGVIRNDLYAQVWKKFFELEIKEHNQIESGNEINFLVTKVENVARFYYGGIIHVVGNVIAYVMCFLMVAYSNFWVAIGCFICTMTMVFLGSRQSGKLTSQQEALQRCREKVLDADLSLLKGQITIQNYQVQEMAEREFQQCNQEFEDCQYQQNQCMNRFELVAVVGNLVVYFSIFIVSCILAYHKGLSIGEIAAILTLCSQLMAKSNGIMYEYGTVMGLSEMKKEVFSYIEKTVEKLQCISAEDLENTPIEVTDVTIGYGEKDILQNVSLTLHKGEKILLLGESGIGKSTLFKSMMKQMEYSKGEIKLFGQKVDALMEDSIFEHICYVEQNPVIFEGTILENIMIGVSEENKDDAITVFQMMNLDKDGLDINQHLTQDGANISQGQRQRISLARGLFQQKKIYLLDEPFSALDRENGAVIERRIMSNPDISVICISHKLMQPELYDVIYKLSSSECRVCMLEEDSVC
ncbi:MAG: ABC transporter ATP-binding protein [Agathobacter sp.]|nr:ABC transporter ATP-binding protein [Agathobacter sp.]